MAQSDGAMGFECDGEGREEDGMASVREVLINGLTMKAAEVEAKLDEGNIQEAESSLREGLSLNYEVWFLPFFFFCMKIRFLRVCWHDLLQV